MKADIEQLIEPHARHGKSGVVIIALLELAMERHLRRFPDQGSTRALVEGVLDKVLTRRSTA